MGAFALLICISLSVLDLAAQTPENQPKDAASATAQATPVPVQVTPLEYDPYRIQVWLASTDSAEIDQRVLAHLEREIVLRSEAVVGAPWSVTVTAPPPELEHTVAYAPELLTDVRIKEVKNEALKDDKITLVSLQANPREIVVKVRELDCHARVWSHTAERKVRQPAALAQTVFDAIVEVFAPLVRIEEGQGKTCTARSRAGGLVLSPDSPAAINKGDALQPIFRQNDRYGDPVKDRVQPLPFTLLHVVSQDPISPSLLSCNVISAMRSPIHGRFTARRERWGVKVRPHYPATELVVESRPVVKGEATYPLAGLEIYAKTALTDPPKTETEEEKKAEEKRNPPVLVGVTDWRGLVTIPNVGPELRIMYIKNGGLLLARLPMISGAEEKLKAEVADDNPRLQAEGFVKGMNGEITDLVVQRQLIAVRVRKFLNEGKIDEAQKLLDEFRGLKTLNDLQRMLDQQMIRQRPTNNPAVKQRIDKLYGDEREMIAKYIDVELLNRLTQEVAAARANPPAAQPTPSETATPMPQETADAGGEKGGSEKKDELPTALQAKGKGG